MKSVPVVAGHLTRERLASYLRACGGDLDEAMTLYDWNVQVSGALHEDIARFEVVFRNTVDRAMRSYGQASAWSSEWYDRGPSLFPGKNNRQTLRQIEQAKTNAVRLGEGRDLNGDILSGKVVAELTLGFWRFLCASRHLTSMGVPAIAAAFEHHPDAGGNADVIRRDVEDRVQRVHFLRNRVAHHEPVHKRNLSNDLAAIIDVVGWISPPTADWITESSRTPAAIATRP